MSLFTYQGRLAEGGAQLRAEQRPKHLAYLEGLGDRVCFGGPLIDEHGEPAGSLIIVEAEDYAAATAIARADPYVAGGVLEGLEVFETKQVLPAGS